MSRLFPLALLSLLACGTDGESGGTDGVDCSDPDGSGGDTGNIPAIAGDWTSSWAAAFWDDNCSVADFDQASEDWIGAFTVEGAFNSFSASFHQSPDDTFAAAMDRRGGFTMSGEHEHDAGLIYANFSGLVHADSSGRTKIDGSGYLGIDTNDDQVADCFARASWTANKSGL